MRSDPAPPRRAGGAPWVPGDRIVRRSAEPDEALPDGAPTIGVLALQGDVLEHVLTLRAVGARAVRVRRPAHLDGIDGLVVPGGESTTIARLLGLGGLLPALREAVAGGLPVFGTCAGLILLSERLADDVEPRDRIGGLDVTTRRNAFGRQVDSFEADIDLVEVDGGPVRAVFIRAPWVEQAGSAVEVLAEVDGRPVIVAQGPLLAAAFHPEVSGEERLHRWWLERVRAAAWQPRAQPGTEAARR